MHDSRTVRGSGCETNLCSYKVAILSCLHNPPRLLWLNRAPEGWRWGTEEVHSSEGVELSNLLPSCTYMGYTFQVCDLNESDADYFLHRQYLDSGNYLQTWAAAHNILVTGLKLKILTYSQARFFSNLLAALLSNIWSDPFEIPEAFSISPSDSHCASFCWKGIRQNSLL